MNIILDENYYIVKASNETLDANVGQSVHSYNVTVDYTGYILYNNIFVQRPTPYHTASKGSWILTDENNLLLFQVLQVTINKILSLCANGMDDNFIQEVHNIHHCPNNTRAYLTLQKLIADAPSYINKNDFVME